MSAVLTQLRGSGEELACVVDEYGGLAGVITLEDYPVTINDQHPKIT